MPRSQVISKKNSKVWTIIGLARKYSVSSKTMRKYANEFELDLFDVESLMDFAIWMNKRKNKQRISVLEDKVVKNYPSMVEMIGRKNLRVQILKVIKKYDL